MIITTETLIVNTDHLLWVRKEKQGNWIMVCQGTGLSTTNILEEEAQALLRALKSAPPRPVEAPALAMPSRKVKPPERP